MRLRGFVALALLAAVAGRSEAQAIDCAAARSPSERAICADAGLMALERDYAALHAAADPARQLQLQLEHAVWVQLRELCAANTRCLAMWYEARLAELRPQAPPGPSDTARQPPAPGGVLRVIEAPDLRVLGREALRRDTVDRIGAIGALSLLGSQPVGDPAPPGPAPGDGRISVMPDGTIQKRLEGGVVAFFNPVTNQTGQINPDGTRMVPYALQVQSDAPPALPPDYAGWSQSVSSSVSGLVSNLLTPAEAETLRSNAPADFFDNLDYHLRILAFITG